MQSVDWLTRFYFGSENGEEGGIARAGGLKRIVSERLGDIDARERQLDPADRRAASVVVRVGRYGPYLQRGRRQRGPACPRTCRRTS